jgi:hypothetical protein
MELQPPTAPDPGREQPVVFPADRQRDGGFRWQWLLIGCGSLLVLTCACLAATIATYAYLNSRAGILQLDGSTPTRGSTPVRTPARATGTATPLPGTPALGETTPSTVAPLPEGWLQFNDPSGKVRLAYPAGWNVYYEGKTCCNVTLVSFDPGTLPSGRVTWAPPGTGAEHEVPPGQLVIDLFLVAPPFAEQPPDFGRPPDGEDIVGGTYHADLYFSAPYTDWPTGQVITYLYTDDSGRQWCLVAYFGTPFEQDLEHLAILGQVLATIDHPR